MPSIDISAKAATEAESVAGSYGSDLNRVISSEHLMETPYLREESPMPFDAATKGMAGWIGSATEYEDDSQFNSKLLVPNNTQEADRMIQSMKRAFAAMRVLEELEVDQSYFTLSQPLEILHRCQRPDALGSSHTLDRGGPELKLAGSSLSPLKSNCEPNSLSQKGENVVQGDLEGQRLTDRPSKKPMGTDSVLSFLLLVSAVALGITLPFWFWAR